MKGRDTQVADDDDEYHYPKHPTTVIFKHGTTECMKKNRTKKHAGLLFQMPCYM